MDFVYLCKKAPDLPGNSNRVKSTGSGIFVQALVRHPFHDLVAERQILHGDVSLVDRRNGESGFVQQIHDGTFRQEVIIICQISLVGTEKIGPVGIPEPADKMVSRVLYQFK